MIPLQVSLSAAPPNSGGQRKRVGVRTVERALVAYGKKRLSKVAWSSAFSHPTAKMHITSFPSANRNQWATYAQRHIRRLLSTIPLGLGPLSIFSPTMQGTYTHVYPKDRFLIPALKVR